MLNTIFVGSCEVGEKGRVWLAAMWVQDERFTGSIQYYKMSEVRKAAMKSGTTGEYLFKG